MKLTCRALHIWFLTDFHFFMFSDVSSDYLKGCMLNMRKNNSNLQNNRNLTSIQKLKTNSLASVNSAHCTFLKRHEATSFENITYPPKNYGVIEKSYLEDRQEIKIFQKTFLLESFEKCHFLFLLVLFPLSIDDFLHTLHHTYPSTITIATIYPRIFTKPAITLCNSNPINRSKFCEEHSHLCEERFNTTEISNTGKEYQAVLSTMHEIYTHKIKLDSKSNPWSWSISNDVSGRPLLKTMKTTFVRDELQDFYVTCYSSNLHLQSDTDPETMALELKPEGYMDIFNLSLQVEEDEAFFPWVSPQVFLAIHSPFVPINPLDEGHILKGGHVTYIYVQLEMEHLLPHPYQTNCTNYDSLWRKNKREPRSLEMCREWCRAYAHNEVKDCDYGRTMIEIPRKVCKPGHFYTINKKQQFQNCSRDCRSNCTKLKYKYTVTEKKLKRYLIESNRREEMKTIRIFVRLKTPEVTVMSHTPSYDIEEMFSYIGGLLGCWLGISVWAFAGMVESFFRRIVQLIRKLKRKSKRSRSIKQSF